MADSPLRESNKDALLGDQLELLPLQSGRILRIRWFEDYWKSLLPICLFRMPLCVHPR